MSTIEKLRKQADDLEIQEHLKPYALTDRKAADELETLARQLQDAEKCPFCKGKGGFDIPEDSVECSMCKGTGKLSMEAVVTTVEKSDAKGYNFQSQLTAAQSERDEFHRCLLAREQTLKEEGDRWVKAMTERDAAQLQNGKMREAVERVLILLNLLITISDDQGNSAFVAIQQKRFTAIRTERDIIREALTPPSGETSGIG